MAFKGRTVLVFILLSVFASSLITLTVAGSLDSSPFWKNKQASEGADDGAYADSESLTSKDIGKIETTYGLIKGKYYAKVDRQKVVDGAITGMLSALNDPYSVYMDPEESKNFTEHVDSSFTGIGAEVTQENGKVTVISPIKGSPAEKAGIHANDVILSVNGESLQGININEAVKKMRGPKGTQAKLEIQRPGTADTIHIVVVRDDIDIETVYSSMKEGKIGVIEIRQFSQHTAERFNEELASLEAKGMKGLIIDVRNNPGGYLYGVLEIVQPLVPKGKTVVQIEYGNKKRQKTVSEGPGKKYPISVLINKGSASASEILAGALQESAGAKVVGETSFGKGTVQTVFEKELGDGSNIKMTIAKWLTPNGKWINQKGIAPDVKVEQPAFFKAAPINNNAKLKYDMNNDDVKNMQIILQGLGYDPGRIDGYFSSKTELAVKAFQRMQNLPVTGEVEATTIDKLEAAIVDQFRDPKYDLQMKEAVKLVQSEN